MTHDLVTLSWDDPGDDTISGYVILRRDKDVHPQGTFVTLAPHTGTAATTYIDASIDPERRYVYRVKAVNAAGTSDRSTWVRAYTPVAPAKSPALPARPAGLTTEPSHDTVTLSWDDSADGTISGYVILRRDKDVHPRGTFQTINADTGTAATSYLDTTAEPERRYVYRIKAVNSHGYSTISSWARGYTPAAPRAIFIDGDNQNDQDQQDGTGGHDQDQQAGTDQHDQDQQDGTGGHDQDQQAGADQHDQDQQAGTDQHDQDQQDGTDQHDQDQQDGTDQHDQDQQDGTDQHDQDQQDGTGGQDGTVGVAGHARVPGPGTRANVSEGIDDLPADDSTTGQVDVGGTVTGTIETVLIGVADDRDWFTVELEAGTKYEIAVTGFFTDAVKAIFNAPSRTPDYGYDTSSARYSLHAPAVTVRDSDGDVHEVGRASTVISSSDPCRPLYLENWDPIVEFTPDVAGTYSIEVASLGSGNYWRRGPPDSNRRCHSWNVQFDAVGTYEMSVREWPPHISKGPTAESSPSYWYWKPNAKPKFREPLPAHEAYTGAFRPPGEPRPTHSPNTYGRGETIEFAMEFTEAVTVTGVPELNLRGAATGDRHRGSGDRWFKYLSGSGTNGLVFSYTVQSGDYDEQGFRTGDWWSGSKLTWRLRGDAAITSVATGSHAVLEAYVGHAYSEGGRINGRVTTP